MAPPIINRVKTHTRNFESYFKFSRNLENKICTFVETRYFYFSNYLKNDREFLFSLRLEGEEKFKYRCVCRPQCEKVTTMGAHKVRLFCFWLEIPFLGELVKKKQKKIKIVSLSWNLNMHEFENPNMQNSVVMLTFSVFDWNYPFWTSLAQKMKIVNLKVR